MNKIVQISSIYKVFGEAVLSLFFVIIDVLKLPSTRLIFQVT